MDWLSKLFPGHPEASAQIAKNRLKLVLSYDRSNLTPELLAHLQDEIVNVISRHLDIDRVGMSVTTERGEKGDHLVADIPILGVHPHPPVAEHPTHGSKKKHKKY